MRGERQPNKLWPRRVEELVTEHACDRRSVLMGAKLALEQAALCDEEDLVELREVAAAYKGPTHDGRPAALSMAAVQLRMAEGLIDDVQQYVAGAGGIEASVRAALGGVRDALRAAEGVPTEPTRRARFIRRGR